MVIRGELAGWLASVGLDGLAAGRQQVKELRVMEMG